MGLARVASFEDFRLLARRRLPHVLFEYIDGGSYSEVTIRRNAAAFDRLELRQRVMRDMRGLDMQTELFGQEMAMPLVLGPVGFAGMYARRGEVQAARAAREARLPFCLSTMGICSIEEVGRGARPPWFQLYMVKDRGVVVDLLARASAAGSAVLVLTVDLPISGARYRDVRSGMSTAQGWRGQLGQAGNAAMHPAWLYDVWLRGRPHNFGNLTAAGTKAMSFGAAWDWIGDNFDRSVTWADLDFIRQHWDDPIVIKGIMDAEDARDAASAGVQGIVVSNHGGRQLDGTPASLHALPAIAEAVGDQLSVLVDGGVRSGLDILKARALGADACIIGKAWAFALAAGGRAGVAKLIDTIRQELRVAMILTGCNDIKTAGKELLVRGVAE